MARQLTRTCSRRSLLCSAGIGGLAILSAACSAAPPPAPTTAPAAPPAKPAATAAPTAKPAAGAPAPATQAPAAKPAFKPAVVRVASIEGNLTNVNWMAGLEKGFFKEFGIERETMLMKDETLEATAVVAGQADFTDNSFAPALVNREKGGTLRIIGNTTPGLDFVVFAGKNTGINSIKDLEGKSVGMAAPGSLPYLLMMALFEKAGVDKSKVEIVNVGASPVVYQAVVAGKVDAGPSKIDFLPTADRDGVKSIVEVWKELPDFVRGGMFTTEQMIATKADEIARTMAALAKSYRYVVTPESKDLYVKIAVDQLKVRPESAQLAWQFQKDNNIVSLNLEVTPKQTDFMQRMNILAGTQTRVLPFEQVTDLSLQKRALELVGKV